MCIYIYIYIYIYIHILQRVAGDRVVKGEKWILFYNWPGERTPRAKVSRVRTGKLVKS